VLAEDVVTPNRQIVNLIPHSRRIVAQGDAGHLQSRQYAAAPSIQSRSLAERVIRVGAARIPFSAQATDEADVVLDIRLLRYRYNIRYSWRYRNCVNPGEHEFAHSCRRRRR
jgi:hypothetical protein